MLLSQFVAPSPSQTVYTRCIFSLGLFIEDNFWLLRLGTHKSLLSWELSWESLRLLWRMLTYCWCCCDCSGQLTYSRSAARSFLPLPALIILSVVFWKHLLWHLGLIHWCHSWHWSSKSFLCFCGPFPHIFRLGVSVSLGLDENWSCLLESAEPEDTIKPKIGIRKDLLVWQWWLLSFVDLARNTGLTVEFVTIVILYYYYQEKKGFLPSSVLSNKRARKENTRYLSQATSPRTAKLGKFQAKGACIFMKGLDLGGVCIFMERLLQRKKHRIRAKVDRIDD